QLFELVLDDGPEPALGSEDRFDLLGFGPLLLQLVENLADFQLGDLVQLGVEDRDRLLLIELEGPLQLLGCVGLAVAVADDPDGPVERVEDDLEAFEDVDPLAELPQLVLEAAADGGEAEGE